MVVVDTRCHATPYLHQPVEILLKKMELNGMDKAILIQIIGRDSGHLLEVR